MKKGYVLEVKEEYLLVMTEDQRFLRLQKKQGVDAGEEIKFSENQVLDIPSVINRKEQFMKKIKHVKPMGIAAAMVLFLVLSIFAVSGGEDEAQYLLSFDVNPSVEIKIGENEEVLKVFAANDEAKELELEDLEGESLEVFLNEFLDKLAKNNYLNEESNEVLLSYADLLDDDQASQDLVDRITEQMEQYFAANELMVNINTLSADVENYEKAQEAGITIGKFQLMEAILNDEADDVDEITIGNDDSEDSEDPADSKDADDSMDRQALQEKSVRELLEHPVFERHPRNRKADGRHPVFDNHPSDWDKEDGEKPHPVFDIHPRDWNKEDGKKPHPVFDEHPGNRDKDEEDPEDGSVDEEGDEYQALEEEDRDEKEGHPVLDRHPRDRDKEAGEHPVFEQHPRDRVKNQEPDSEDSQDEDNGTSNDNRSDEDSSEDSDETRGPKDKKDHPVFKTHPGNRGNGNS